MTKSLRVGIIGASPARGWAKESHIPAVQKLPGLELAAVATNSQHSPDAAAAAFGAKAAYGDVKDLFRDRSIDLVTVAVRVPAHRELVLQALAAGKHVYCEWPLARDLGESQELAAAAHKAGVRTAIGLQARGNPAAKRARDLIVSDAIGRLLSARIYSGTVAFGPQTAAVEAYLEEAENGATLVTIHAGHALDIAIAVLGGLADISALGTTQYPEIQIGDRHHARSLFDHFLVQARLASGAALSVEVAGGRPPDTPFRFEVTGETGTLVLEGGAPRGFQSGRLQLSVNGEPQSIAEGEAASMPDTAANVAGVYAALRDDILQGTSTAPDFDHAVRLAALIEDLNG